MPFEPAVAHRYPRRPVTIVAISDTTEIISDPGTAGQNPSTWKLRPRRPAAHALTISIAALITIANSPNVSTIRHAENSAATGFSNMFTIAKIAVPATSDYQSLIRTPGTIAEARNSPAALIAARNSIPLNDPPPGDIRYE